MDSSKLDNPNPHVKTVARPTPGKTKQTLQQRVFDLIRDIRDPEHPHSLEELSVVDMNCIQVKPPPSDSPGYGKVSVTFTPTVPHCSLASIIGLSIQAKVSRSGVLKRAKADIYYKLQVRCAEDAHASADDINRQLADKERVSAAFENPKINSLLDQCINNLPM